MKIAMFTDYFFPELGGIQDSIATLSRALGQRGHQVDIYAPRYGARDYSRVQAAAREPDLGANVRVWRRPSLPFPSSTKQSRAALPSPIGWAALAYRTRPDVIHAHSFFGVGLEALLNGACLNIPVVGTNHTTVAGFGPYIPISIQSATAYVLWFYNRCDWVTAPSRSVFEELGTDLLTPPRLVIANPIDTALFRPLDEPARLAIRARLGLQGPVVTFAGRLGPEKNIDVLLRAVARLARQGRRVELAVAGHGSHQPVLEDLAMELGIAGQIRFLGTLAHAELAELLQVSDIFAMMSTSETQSMVLTQAMACGIPVVGANSRALPEFVGPANGVLVAPHDPPALASALADLIDDPERRRHLGAGGRRMAEQCGIEMVTNTWESLYQTVLSGSRAA
jgi:glycosyltransferase involved in cell wall biosynthesis